MRTIKFVMGTVLLITECTLGHAAVTSTSIKIYTAINEPTHPLVCTWAGKNYPAGYVPPEAVLGQLTCTNENVTDGKITIMKEGSTLSPTDKISMVDVKTGEPALLVKLVASDGTDVQVASETDGYDEVSLSGTTIAGRGTAQMTLHPAGIISVHGGIYAGTLSVGLWSN